MNGMPPDRFDVCIPYTLIQECPDSQDWSNAKNFSNDAHDPGGATMCGIIQREYNAYRKAHGLPTQPVRNITREEGMFIYKQSYWLPHCPKLLPGLDLQFFDAAVNMGETEAIKLMQHVCGAVSDGVWGPATDKAVNDKQQAGLTALVEAYTQRRLAVYESFSGFRYFGTDWTRRAKEIGAEALKMAQAGG